eukprot:TRINITY_DN26295_c0_g1_i1.p1 TRINITY_DN26295_c0_g1~~TRINITY_DN26295_c0_g1_i1.p1  ORF type:complete len:450 (+),score=119.76 TRINITY_DN26295_c0_g1_i1:119-1468(+)
MGCLESKEDPESAQGTEAVRKGKKGDKSPSSAADKELRKWSYHVSDDKWKMPTKEEFMGRFDGDRERMQAFLNVSRLYNDIKVFKPGELDGYDVTVSGCNGADIYILDNSSQVQVDDCTNCRFFIAPCGGSVFIRNCSNIRVAVAASQLRLRECNDVKLMVYVRRRSVVESCKRISIACWNTGYFQLSRQMSRATLSVFDNGWNNFDDFGTHSVPTFLPISTTLESIMHVERLPARHTPQGESLVPPDAGDADSVTSSVINSNDAIANIQWRTLAEVAPDCMAEAGTEGEGLNPVPISTGDRSPQNALFVLFSPRCGDAARTVAMHFSNSAGGEGLHVAAMREFGPAPRDALPKLLHGLPELEKTQARRALFTKGPLIGLLLTSSKGDTKLADIVLNLLQTTELCVAQSTGLVRPDSSLDKGQACLWGGPEATTQASVFIDELRGALDG